MVGLPAKETTMPGTNARSAVTCVGLGLLLCGILLVPAPGTAGILDATWTAPTTNTDGSPLLDLVSYWLYYDTSSSPCPGSSAVQVASPTSSPGPNQTISVRLTALTTGTLYNVAVSAVDAIGNQSACSSIASAVARADFALSPTGTVNFGSVNLGSFAEQTFTVSNTGGGTISGSASVVAPFNIVSGSPFTLSGVGATQPVTVRFRPTTTATVSTTVSFTASGGTIAGIVTGTGTGTNAPTPALDVTAPIISKTSLSVTSSGATIGWMTNEPSDTQVEYGLTGSYGSLAPLNTALVTSHSQVINGLAPNTWYHFRMRSRDAAGNLAMSGDYKFKTRAH